VSIKDLVVHLDGGARCAMRTRIAADLAMAFDAHLIGVAPTGLVAPDNDVELEATYYRHASQARRVRAAAATAAFDRLATDRGVDSFEHLVAEDAHVSAIALQGRYADLVVIGQGGPEDVGGETHAWFAEQVFVDASTPLLIVPGVGAIEHVGRQILIAWNASREAARAVGDALSLLARASRVEILILNERTAGNDHGEEPGAELAAHLARHGVAASVRRDRTELAVGDALLSRASDGDFDLLVIGGYSHSRFREILLGGVTRTVLDSMTVPVLISH
jgi:nucleotide-binding universal stress UspA family protein